MLDVLIRHILGHADRLDWSVQGLGMIRCYLDTKKIYRLHIWNSAFRIPGVSAIHTHPWDMESYVAFGRLHQFRYFEELRPKEFSEPYHYATIKPGENPVMLHEPRNMWLTRGTFEHYEAGDLYTQRWAEIHESLPEDGTVTVVKRIVPIGGPDAARVFWRGLEFVDAAPRQATTDEIVLALNGAGRWLS